MLRVWKQTSPSEATNARLIEALQEIDRGDLADDVKKWKGRKCELLHNTNHFSNSRIYVAEIK
ncbi:hypothetical protein HOLleu_20879 [Holothuria leucospilota]|uniref:Death domain-containing protein n=1 Tax=Holothuria leucospilota TaxID=206669 RepID=A0A9Q1BWJ2_HOLLE|nr:hypothetical protein HOLleu_20879 [Holothuria leucospilota]